MAPRIYVVGWEWWISGVSHLEASRLLDPGDMSAEYAALRRVAAGDGIIIYDATTHLLRDRWGTPGGAWGWAQVWSPGDPGSAGDKLALELPQCARSHVLVLDTSGTGAADKYRQLGMRVFTNEHDLISALKISAP